VIRGSAITATYLTGLAIDEVIARYTAQGARSLLTDALGSVILAAKEDGSVQTAYGYSPYGETQVMGTDEGNPVQYTARENDGTGLYYYRARYYDPTLKQWASEDPIGIAGGLNVYNYVERNPVSFTDPDGLKTMQCTKPLNALGQKWGPLGYKYGPMLYHQYSCVVDKNGKVTCGGQDRGANGQGKPSNDVLDPPGGQCKQTQPDNDCFEQCLISEWAKPRPKYGIPIGTDCQDYDDDVNTRCRKQCNIKK
jgi:RHS repeat-associated protein